METSYLSGLIEDLLHRQKLVILPGFGGLLMQYRSAYLDPEGQIFHPPSKRLVFNQQLRDNDGLLMAYIARQSGISYAHAEAYCYRQISSIRGRLAKGEQVRLGRLGSWKLNHEGALLYTPGEMGHIPEFGFEPLALAPHASRTTGLLDTSRLDERKHQRNKRNTMYSGMTAAAMLLMAALLVFNAGRENSMHESAAMVELEEAQKEYQNKEQVPGRAGVDAKTQPLAMGQGQEAKEPVEGQKEYFIIAGSFETVEGARKFIRQMDKHGYEAFMLRSDGRVRIAYQRFLLKQDAVDELARIREFNANAWVYSKPLAK